MLECSRGFPQVVIVDRAERRRREARRKKCTRDKCTLPTIPLGPAGQGLVMMMMIDVVDQAAKAPASISIMERSLFSERYCFVQVGDHYSH